MRWARALALPLLMAAMVACGTSPGGASSSTGNGDGNGSSSEATATPEATQNPGSSQDNGNGNGTGSHDVDGLISALTPPNSTESTRTTAQGGAFISWESTDSVDSLKGFYENAINGTGMQVISTSTVSGTYSWIFAEDQSGSYGGSVTIAPSGSGSGTTVVVTVSDSGS